MWGRVWREAFILTGENMSRLELGDGAVGCPPLKIGIVSCVVASDSFQGSSWLLACVARYDVSIKCCCDSYILTHTIRQV